MLSIKYIKKCLLKQKYYDIFAQIGCYYNIYHLDFLFVFNETVSYEI